MADSVINKSNTNEIYDVNHGVVQSVINNGLRLDKVYGDADNPINIDKINNNTGYIYRILVGEGFSGTSPHTVIGGANSYLLLGYSVINAASQLPSYGVQIAFGFSGNIIAMRHASYAPAGNAWGAWEAI